MNHHHPMSSPVMTCGARWSRRRSALLACTALSLVVTIPAPSAHALPQGGTIVQGTGQIIAKSATEIDVIQSSQKLVINWSSFNIAAGEKVLFVQTSALMQVLNRVVGPQSSTILGELQANGTIILVNPNGILFGAGSQVKVGAIIATPTGIADANFMAGNLVFDSPSTSATASVVNRGTITAADAGLVGLVAPGVENSGVIQARLGTVQLASGNSFSVDLYGDKLINLVVSDKVSRTVTAPDGQSLQALVSNSGTINADGGAIILSANAARDILTNVINMGGVAQARSVGTTNGKIVLDGGDNGTVAVSGTADATGTQAGASGGAVTVAGDTITVIDGAKLLAGGAAGGGAVTVSAARAVSVAAGASLDASATADGDGGTATVISNGSTTVAGTLTATGGAAGGDGGTIETSGGTLDVSGATISAASPKGKSGSWLLDPYDLLINSAAAASINSALANDTSVTLQTTASTATTAYGGTSNAGGSGDITIASALSWNTAATLTLDAYHSVLVNANITGTNLAIKYNDGGSGGNFLVSGATVNLPTGTGHLAINGTAFTTVGDLSPVIANPAGAYALASDIAGGSHSASVIANLTGSLEGLGHTISNLGITSSSDYTGLIGTVASGATVRNLILSGASITGHDYVGALAGSNNGDVVNVAVTGGNVIGYNHAGGLVGDNAGTVSASTASSAVSNGFSVSNNIGGLVGYNTATGTVSDSNATGTVSGYSSIGGLVGGNAGIVSDSSATGAVSGDSYLGGLVGYNTSTGTVSDSYATGALSATLYGGYQFGGLVGQNDGKVSASYASGAVSGNEVIGGLVGMNTGTVSDSVATGNASGWGGGVGGLVGGNTGTISASAATGNVNGGSPYSVEVGGLVGSNTYTGTVSDSYATGTVTGGGWMGGLVGDNYGTVRTSYATGAVSGAASGTNVYIGGLIGWNLATVSDSYATGAVSGSSEVGGLVGLNTGTAHSADGTLTYYGTVSNSYATGAVRGGNSVGGLVGDNGGTVSTSYWDTTATGQLSACGTGTCGGTGLTSTQMKSLSTNASANVYNWDFSSAWNLVGSVNSSYPFLRTSPFVLTIGAGTQTATYGDALSSAGYIYNNLWSRDTSAVVRGLTLSGAGQGSSVGTYNVSLSGATATSLSGIVYTILYEAGSVAIIPRTISYSIGNVRGPHGSALPGQVTWSNLYGSDDPGATVGLSGSGGSYFQPVGSDGGYTIAANTKSGTYAVTVTELSNGNYTLAGTGNRPGVLTIGSPLTPAQIGMLNAAAPATVSGLPAADPLTRAVRVLENPLNGMAFKGGSPVLTVTPDMWSRFGPGVFQIVQPVWSPPE